ncbi:DUF6326 family protein [Lentzea sp. NBRC 102530]|uniref:DUF6326 family protein n=1 Tax=Lentzea sp. NBRC 102530 TaxID=3032201 RepID=UPI00249FD987|nr:DUF6326 family protein [Lentzea sp. NBRC 102530]GLY47688.1 hypothetical protein Lesp01_13440 [Lentzea sp. NBRC 102530]
MTTPKQYQDTPIDVKLVLCGLWITTLFLFAYVDIFGFFRADLIQGVLDGRVANTPFVIDQAFLIATTGYIVPPILMVVLTLTLRPRVNRMVNIVASCLYLVSILASCIGETWIYYILGSLAEAVLLAVVARVAWRWPAVVSAA